MILKQFSLLSVLFFCLAGSYASGSSHFEDKDTLKPSFEVKVDEIEVPGLKTANTFRQSAAVVRVINREQLKNLPVQTLEGLLEYISSVDMRQRGPEGVQSDLTIRGSSSNQVLILLNGINITDPQTGHHNLNLPVDFSQIERIEILEGSSARIYAPNAFAGAVNIITGELDQSEVRLNLEAGSHKFYNTGIGAGVRTGPVSHTFSLNWKRSDGYTENTDFDFSNLFYSGSALLKKGTLSFQAGFSDKGYGANSFYTPKYPDQYENTQVLFTAVNFRSVGKMHLNPVIFWRRHQDEFMLFRKNPPSWYKTNNYHLTDVYGAGFSSWFSSGIGKTSFGLHLRKEDIFSNVLGEPLSEPVGVMGRNALYTKKGIRDIYSAFAEHEVSIGNFIFSAALMSFNDRLNNGSVNWRLSPALDLSYKLKDNIRLYASWNNSVRLPTFTEFYYSDPTHRGNPLLKNETSTSFEAGMKAGNRFLSGNISLFFIRGKDLIDWVREPDSLIWETMNFTKINYHGIEINAEIRPGKIFGESFFISLIRIGFLNNSQEKINTQLISYYLLDYLNNKLNISVQHDLFKNIYANWEIVFQDRKGTFTRFTDNHYAEEVSYKPFWLLDGKLTYRLKGIAFYVSGTNLMNKSYFDYGNIKQSGLWLKAGLVADFNMK
jgi:vitamin B12 transporter